MPNAESTEVQLARIDERYKTILNELIDAKSSRKHQYEQMETFGQGLTIMNGRMESVEKALAASAPTIEEFITIKHKVVGAGMAGKWIWAAGGFVLSAVIFLREGWASWFK